MPKSEVFLVTPELQQVLDNQPAKTPRSILDPFRAFILRWRREGRTYRDIQQILAAECKVRVHHETLRRFIRRRSRPRKPQPDLEFEPATVQPVESSSAAVSAAARKPRMSIEERRAQADAIRAQFAKPEFQPKEKPKPLFDYDPDRPLTNKPQTKDR
jgi:hypothetical protein